MNRNLKRKLLAGLFVPMLVGGGTALAQGTTVVFLWDAQTFQRLDKNNDGQISSEEAQADPMMKDNWTKLDSTKRGNVSRAEFEDYGRKLNPNSATPKGHPFDGTPKK